MTYAGMEIWGDSLLKGVVFDEIRNCYTILKDNCVAQLKALLPFPIQSRTQMGMTAAQAVERARDEPAMADALFLIEFGGNDCGMNWKAIAADPTLDHQPNTPLADFAEKLSCLVAHARAAGAEPMLAIPTPLHAPRYFDWVTRGLDRGAVLSFLGAVDRMYRWQEAYACTVYRTAVKMGCPAIDLRTPFLERRQYEDLLCIDGIHPNAAGHALMLETLREALC